MKLDLTLMAILKLRYSMTSSFAFQRGQTANCRNYVSHADVFRRVLYSEANPGIFDGWGGGKGGPKFDSERTVELFCGKLLLSHALK